MTRWFRFYEESINDPKLLRLSDELYRAWTILLCFASKNDGILPPADDIAVALRMKPAKVAEWITKLVRAELIDNVDGQYQPHNWGGRQYKSDVSTERVKRFRNGKRNVSETPSETAPETEQITDTETEQKKKEARAIALSPDWRLWFDTFWQAWPNKVGKPAAQKAIVAAAKRGANLDAIIAGVQRYIRDKPPDRPWLNPATFLNQNRWEDQPAQVQNGKTSSISSACNIVLDRVITGFGGPAPQDRFRGGTDETDARLLSYGGREQS